MQGKPGDFLVAHPLLEDENFERSVVLLTQWDEHGASGLIVNRLSDYTLDQALRGDWPSWPLYFGGPVGTDSLYFLHQRPDLISNGSPVGTELYFGGDFDSMRYAVRNELISADEIRFTAGYAGWSSGQLESELAERSWVLQPARELRDWWGDDSLYRSLANDWPDELKLWVNKPDVPHWN
ncbi:MAG: YqgE/AlgH family protein [Schleiferiaceae bacterium]